MIKKLLLGVAVVIIGLVISIFVILGKGKYDDYLVYQKNLVYVQDYLDSTYDIDCELVYQHMGEDAYPADREPDVFVFYDCANAFYFKMRCANDVISDGYMPSYYGNQVVQTLPSALIDDCVIWCTADQSAETYRGIYFEMAYLYDDVVDWEKLYEIYSTLENNYPELQIMMVVAPARYREQYEERVHYQINEWLTDLPNDGYSRFTMKTPYLETIAQFKECFDL